MSPVTLAEWGPQTRAKVFQQIGETEETPALATVVKETFMTLGDPAAMTDDQLADIVIDGVKKMRAYLPYIVAMKERFDEGNRDSRNRLKTPIKGCFSWKEFCRKCLDRAPQSIGELTARATASEPADPKTPASVEPVNSWQPDATDDCMPVYTRASEPSDMCALCIEHPHKITDRPFDYSMHPELQTQTASRSHGMGLERLRKLASELNVACAIKYDDGFKITCTYSFASEAEAKSWLQAQPK